MTFKCDNDIKFSGSCLRGYVNASYQKLVETFGPPCSDGDGYKVDAEWLLEFEDGTIATIYNYKDGYNYCGEVGIPVEEITEWQIGGFNGDSVLRVEEALNGTK